MVPIIIKERKVHTMKLIKAFLTEREAMEYIRKNHKHDDVIVWHDIFSGKFEVQDMG